MNKRDRPMQVEEIAQFKAHREMSELHLAYVNGSKMVGFKIVEAVNSASAVHLTLVTDTGSVRISMTFEWGTPVEVEETWS